MSKTAREPRVLLCVLKDERDLRLLLRRRLYRIPEVTAPKRSFEYLAFYQPRSAFPSGGRIRYFARVLGRRSALRSEILPREAAHPRAGRRYVLFRVARPRRLSPPVRNLAPRRVTFAYAPLRRLLRARDLLEALGVAAIERIMRNRLRRTGLSVLPEHPVTALDGARLRIDLAVRCRRGGIAIECDGSKAHRGRAQRRKDRAKDGKLARLGWTVLRFGESEILEQVDACVERVCREVRRSGGPLTLPSPSKGRGNGTLGRGGLRRAPVFP